MGRAAARRIDDTDAVGVPGVAEGFDSDAVLAPVDVGIAVVGFGTVVVESSVVAVLADVGTAVVALADSAAAVCGIAAAGAAVFGTVVAGTTVDPCPE